MRLSWYGHKHVFKVYPLIGPVSIDPLQPAEVKLPQPSVNDKTITSNVKFDRPSASDEATVGVSRSVINNAHLADLLRLSIVTVRERQALAEPDSNSAKLQQPSVITTIGTILV